MSSERECLHHPVRAAVAACRPHIIAAAIFSAVANLLLLTPSIYMMQVYDRIVPTGALVSLAAISLVALFALGIMALLDWLRGRILLRAGACIDDVLAEPVLDAVLSRPEMNPPARAQALRDLDTLRQGVAAPATIALFDAPWTPIYILAAFLLHPALGLLTLAASAVMLGLAWHNERKVRAPLAAAGEAGNAAYARQLQIASNAADVRALGLGPALTRRQLGERAVATDLNLAAGFSGGGHSAVMRFLRLALQMAALAIGAMLVAKSMVSAGAIFASSLLLARALHPVEQVVGSWKSIVQFREAHRRLTALFTDTAPRRFTALPAPTGALQVERLTVLAPMSDRVALADMSFAVASGEVIGIVGPSGAGKSTLLRALAGAARPIRGHIRFDGASSVDWDPQHLSRNIGYLPQSFMLFPGTVKENIARFRDGSDEDQAAIDAAAVAAAQAIGAHEMILRLPDGYDTVIGVGGMGLSAGQSQRIALARALFGAPRILLLDEPTAHLDGQAQHAFIKMLSGARAHGTTILFATHSGDILASADKMLVVKDGRLERLGSLAETMTPARPASHTPSSRSVR